MNEELDLYNALLRTLTKQYNEAKSGQLQPAYKTLRIVDTMIELQFYCIIKLI